MESIILILILGVTVLIAVGYIKKKFTGSDACRACDKAKSGCPSKKQADKDMAP